MMKRYFERNFTAEKYAPAGVETSDGYNATEDWELWRLMIPPEVDRVGWVVRSGYSVEIAITGRGIVAYRKERPNWMMGNRYEGWRAVRTDKLNRWFEQKLGRMFHLLSYLQKEADTYKSVLRTREELAQEYPGLSHERLVKATIVENINGMNQVTIIEPAKP